MHALREGRLIERLHIVNGFFLPTLRARQYTKVRGVVGRGSPRGGVGGTRLIHALRLGAPAVPPGCLPLGGLGLLNRCCVPLLARSS